MASIAGGLREYMGILKLVFVRMGEIGFMNSNEGRVEIPWNSFYC